MITITENQIRRLSERYPDDEIIKEIQTQSHKTAKANEILDNICDMIESEEFFAEDFEPQLSRLEELLEEWFRKKGEK